MGRNERFNSMRTDNRPEIIKQLSIAREIFDSTSKHDSESENVQLLLGFFYRNKFLNSEQVAFAQKLAKLSQSVRKS